MVRALLQGMLVLLVLSMVAAESEELLGAHGEPPFSATQPGAAGGVSYVLTDPAARPCRCGEPRGGPE